MRDCVAAMRSDHSQTHGKAGSCSIGRAVDGTAQLVEQARNIFANRRQPGKLFSHRGDALFQLPLRLGEDLHPPGKIAIIIARFEAVDLGDQRVVGVEGDVGQLGGQRR